MNTELFIKMVLDAWNTKIASTNKMLAQLSDEQLEKQIAPGKNTGAYLLGHLVAINNKVLPLLGLGTELHPELYKTFVETAEKDIVSRPGVSQLRQQWNEINQSISEIFSKVSPEDWFKKHKSVSEEDFAREPHRNRLNVIINRTNHLDYHLGQLILLK